MRQDARSATAFPGRSLAQRASGLSDGLAKAFTIATVGASDLHAPAMAAGAIGQTALGGGEAEGRSEASRVRLGAGTRTSPSLLTELAGDDSVTVRAAVAMNVAAPHEADLELAQDPDERVRALLARKLAALIPNLPRAQRDRIQEQTQATLALLVEDEAVRVRAAIAAVVAQMPEAPRELILRLANDTAMPVSDPVIRLSPLLSQADLLGLLAAPPSRTTHHSVAGRAGIGHATTDILAASADSAVIATLLANPSAAIREATLDALIDRAADEETWHEPLVRRPSLSPRAAQALSDIVATHLLRVLASRADLGHEMAGELERRLAERLARPQQAAGPDLGEAVETARRLNAQGNLDEEALRQAVSRGNEIEVMALLAVAAELPVDHVERAAKLGSTKGLVSLIWRAGFSMAVAPSLQMLLTHLGPDAVLGPRAGNAFPLADEEMRWQIEFLARSGR